MIIIYYLLFLIIFLGFWIISFVVYAIQGSAIRKSQEILNLKVNNYLMDKNFNCTKKFYITDNFTYKKSKSYKKFLAIDNENKKLCLVDYCKCSVSIVDLNEIVNYEIYENGSSVVTGGGIGSWGAGLFGAQSNKTCKELRLIIRLNTYENPQICYDVIFDTFLGLGVGKTSDIYKKCILSMQEAVSLLEVTNNNKS